MELDRAFRAPARDRALSELRRRQVRPAPAHPVQEPGQGGDLRRGRQRVADHPGGWPILPIALPGHRHRPALRADLAADRWHRRLPGRGLSHRPLAQAPGPLRGQAGGGDRHRGHRSPGHPGDRQDRGPADGLPAPPELVHAAAQPAHHRGGNGRDPPGLPVDLSALLGDRRLLSAHDRPARHVRGQSRGARGVLGAALRLARLRPLARQLPRHAGRPGSERAVLRVRGRQDPRPGERPEGRGAADPQGSRLRDPPGSSRNLLLRGLQPAERGAGQHPRDPDPAHHADRPAHDRAGVRVRHHRVRHRLRRHHRQLRPHRHSRARWREAQGPVEEAGRPPSWA